MNVCRINIILDFFLLQLFAREFSSTDIDISGEHGLTGLCRGFQACGDQPRRDQRDALHVHEQAEGVHYRPHWSQEAVSSRDPARRNLAFTIFKHFYHFYINIYLS